MNLWPSNYTKLEKWLCWILLFSIAQLPTWRCQQSRKKNENKLPLWKCFFVQSIEPMPLHYLSSIAGFSHRKYINLFNLVVFFVLVLNFLWREREVTRKCSTERKISTLAISFLFPFGFDDIAKLEEILFAKHPTIVFKYCRYRVGIFKFYHHDKL